MFDVYKKRTLLSYMKAIIKKPLIVKQNKEIHQKEKLSLV